MIIAGGTYGEKCRYPAWDHIYGSGLRAALAISAVSPGSTLHTYVPSVWHDDVAATLSAFGLHGALVTTDQPIAFGYLHPFELVEEPQSPTKKARTIVAEGDVVLRFGMIEGTARVCGRKVVYDPQSPTNEPFDGNGSRAEQLAWILTRRELLKLGRGIGSEADGQAGDRESFEQAVIGLRDMPNGPNVILVKDGLGGLTIYQGDDATHIKSYCSESYFRIGSGDVLAAAFAHAWGELGKSAMVAADYAARCVSYFVEGPRLPIPGLDGVLDGRTSAARAGDIRILATGDIELQSLVLHTRDWIKELGGTATHEILETAGTAKLAPGTDLILVGARTTPQELERLAASATSHPRVVFWPGDHRELAQRYFPQSRVTDDYASALYHTMRKSEP